ncbi:MAG: OsmC family protein [Actinobacteria bacterium]|nr:OsmC family protein [Actinomycetota bacterium]
MNVRVRWLTDLAFESKNEQGLRYFMDTTQEDGSPGIGPKPMEMLLSALAGCTGMDVVSILNKMRVKINDFYMEVSAKRAEEHPKVFTEIKLTYYLEVENESDKEKVLKAVQLSQEKYCSVGAILKKAAKYDYRIVVNGALTYKTD